MTDPDRLRRQLGGAETARLVQRLRRRLAHGRALTGVLSLDQPTEEERRAVERLLGRRPGRGGSLTVNLDELDRVVRRSGMHSEGLAAAVELLGGAVTVLADARAAEAAAWHTALAPLEALCGRRAELADWYAEAGTLPLLRRLGRTPEAAARLVAELVAVLAELPAGGVPLARLAVHATGDAHALDPDRALSTLALSAVRAAWWHAGSPPASAAERRRALWDAAGVLVDELSSTVLALNLPAEPGSRLHALTSSAAELGEPVVLTLRQIARERSDFRRATIHLCENPTVLAAAADRLGSACPPLVCVNGQPTTAALRLLSALVASGCQLGYHGDFDWGGVRIANLLAARVPWRPWRYDMVAYLGAVKAGVPGSLRGTPTEATWDPGLADTMRQHGVRVEEELVLDELLLDLSAGR
ncbi:TIGR02679 family protein [Plantactinospora sp. KLBMP9567]|uniref:TIGR02679 family protein n=1 Tax=Plantactinospora sp. KLBMP9567 TaxID=3085900 RepID=UPI0029818924|nr:TIGR02679 family protein [Plantactinospora sp. KLBMP9567]MDW5330321.1 TIGR02679 family protein [Plantactinospora sp. KLBMP9567]